MDKIEPQGSKLLIEPIERQNYVTGSGIEAVNLNLAYGKVVEIPPMFQEVYSKGNLVCYPSNAGYSQLYNGVSCLWIDGRGAPEGDVWFILEEQK